MRSNAPATSRSSSARRGIAGDWRAAARACAFYTNVCLDPDAAAIGAAGVVCLLIMWGARPLADLLRAGHHMAESEKSVYQTQ